MPDDERERQELEMEQQMGSLLRAGVGIATMLVAIGGLLYLRQHGREIADYRTFKLGPAELRTIGGTLRDALRGDGRGIIQLGLLALIATPVSRVLFACVAFMRQRDQRYVIVTLVVLGVLLYSMVHGYLEPRF